MDSSSGYASINMSTSLGSPKKTTKSKKLSFWTPKTPEGGLKAFKCQSRALWFLIIASAIVIEYDRLCTQESFVSRSLFFLTWRNWCKKCNKNLSKVIYILASVLGHCDYLWNFCKLALGQIEEPNFQWWRLVWCTASGMGFLIWVESFLFVAVLPVHV